MNQIKCRTCKHVDAPIIHDLGDLGNSNLFVCSRCNSLQGSFKGALSLFGSDHVAYVENSALILRDHGSISVNDDFGGNFSTFDKVLCDWIFYLEEVDRCLFDFCVLDYAVDVVKVAKILSDRCISYWDFKPDFVVGQVKTIEIFCDGACSGNPGPGGWGAILRNGERTKEISGGAKDTTNNQMELTAAIEGLKALKKPCDVSLTSDSKYLVNAIEKGWLVNWKQNGWKTANKKPVKNKELWIALDEQLDIHSVRFYWVKGHAGHEQNERCDELARAALEAVR